MDQMNTSEEQFRQVDPIILDGSLIEKHRNSSSIYVGELTLDIPEARKLRDWLNQVLP